MWLLINFTAFEFENRIGFDEDALLSVDRPSIFLICHTDTTLFTGHILDPSAWPRLYFNEYTSTRKILLNIFNLYKFLLIFKN